MEVSKCAPQEAFRDLERAGGLPPRLKGRAGRPRFKRKKSLDDNKARLTGSVWVSPRHVQLPRIGKVRTKEPTEKLLKLLAEGKARILSATISREADRCPNAYLVPRGPAVGRPLRDAGLFWGRAGRHLIAERLRLNTHRLTAGRTDVPVLGNVWWPCRPREGVGPAEEKALCLWLNSTPGLIVRLAHRTETEGAWVKFKKPTLADMPVPDPGVAAALAGAFDRLRDRELGRLRELAQDPVRAEIDGAVEAALGQLPTLESLRELLARKSYVWAPVREGRPEVIWFLLILLVTTGLKTAYLLLTGSERASTWAVVAQAVATVILVFVAWVMAYWLVGGERRGD